MKKRTNNTINPINLNKKGSNMRKSTKIRPLTFDAQPDSHKIDEKTITPTKKQLREIYKFILRMIKKYKFEISKGEVGLPEGCPLTYGTRCNHVIRRLVQNMIVRGLKRDEVEQHLISLFSNYEIGFDCDEGNGIRRIITNGDELVMVYNLESKQLVTFYYWTDFNPKTKQPKTWA